STLSLCDCRLCLCPHDLPTSPPPPRESRVATSSHTAGRQPRRLPNDPDTRQLIRRFSSAL
ncbi:hypothetical protein HAX54_029488, partial [Datura stramonium]|nr:hypothetical protein [Datura stramonium]